MKEYNQPKTTILLNWVNVHMQYATSGDCLGEGGGNAQSGSMFPHNP